MNKNNKLLEIREVRERFQNKGLNLLTEKYKNNHTLLDCEDKNGYRYNCNVNGIELFKYGKLVYTKNKWSIYNIKKYIENNNITSTLLTEKYKGSKVPMCFRCECGNIYYSSWSDFQNRKKYYCHNCAMKYEPKRIDSDYIFNKYKEHGLEILDGQIYKNNRQLLECKTYDGYRVYKSYNNINKKPYIFSYTFNKKNYVYNVNNYFSINHINCKCIDLLDYKVGIHGQYYILVECECGNIFKSCIDYIKNRKL